MLETPSDESPRSNFPEAMSSSFIMREARFSKLRILGMWAAVVAVTGLGALIGAAAFQGEVTRAHTVMAKTVEGLAAGAMLVIIAEANLPVRAQSKLWLFTLVLA